MNLFTAQRDYRVQEAESVAEVINRREPIIVHVTDEFWTDKFGPVHSPHTKAHNGFERDLELKVPRPCVHAIEPPAKTMFFVKDWALKLWWQPTVLADGSCPVVAARHHDIVTVAFDCIGPVDNCHNRPTDLPQAYRWAYTMFPVVLDDKPDEVFETCWLGVWID